MGGCEGYFLEFKAKQANGDVKFTLVLKDVTAAEVDAIRQFLKQYREARL